MTLPSRSTVLAVIAPFMVGVSLLFEPLFSQHAFAAESGSTSPPALASRGASAYRPTPQRVVLAKSTTSTATVAHRSPRKAVTAPTKLKKMKVSSRLKKLSRQKNRAATRRAMRVKSVTRPASLTPTAAHASPKYTPAAYTPPLTVALNRNHYRDSDMDRQIGERNTPLIPPPPQVIAALRANVAYVQDLKTSTVLFSKNEDAIRPIASISKLMTALVIIDANQPLDKMLEISTEDVDRRRHTSSRLPVGTRLSRADMLHLALMASENRAAHALGRHYPGGIPEFVKAMNEKARQLGMMDTFFVEPTGLSNENVASPRDLVRLLRAAGQRPLIHRYTTDSSYGVNIGRGRTRMFRNTNTLVNNSEWDIKVSKTGFINEAGKCLVMLARLQGREVAIVLLGSHGKYSRIADAGRLRALVQNFVAML